MVDVSLSGIGARCSSFIGTCVVFLNSQVTYAYASFDAPENAACNVFGACQSVRFLLGKWLNNSPHSRPIVDAFGSPLPVSLSVTLLAQFFAVTGL